MWFVGAEECCHDASFLITLLARWPSTGNSQGASAVLIITSSVTVHIYNHIMHCLDAYNYDCGCLSQAPRYISL